MYGRIASNALGAVPSLLQAQVPRHVTVTHAYRPIKSLDGVA